MEQQREILEQLKRTLQMLTVEPSKNDQTVNENKEKREKRQTGNSWCVLEDNYEGIAQKFIEFIYKNPTTYHVVSFFAELLKEHDFKYLSEKSNWNDSIGENGGKFYTIRNGTNLSAFILGKNWKAEKGVGVIGSHVDLSLIHI